MKVVIDIPDNIYSEYKYQVDHRIDSHPAKMYIANGIPLPKGHGDLIDRQSLIDNGIEKGFCDWYNEMKYAPTIIEADKAESEE